MRNKMNSVNLMSYESLLKIPALNGEQIIDVPLNEIHDYEKGNKFHVFDDSDDMKDTMDSIEKSGIIQPLIVRKREEGGYELISGHWRKRACELLHKGTVPVICREYSDAEADDVLIESNLGRSNRYPSELAWMCKKKLDTMGHQGKASDLGEAAQSIGRRTGKSVRSVYRYARLTYLIPELLDKVDAKKLGVSAAAEISYLTEEQQVWLMHFIVSYDVKISVEQAKKMKGFSEEGSLTEIKMQEILFAVPVKQKSDAISFDGDIRSFFPIEYDEDMIKDTVYQLLGAWAESTKE